MTGNCSSLLICFSLQPGAEHCKMYLFPVQFKCELSKAVRLGYFEDKSVLYVFGLLLENARCLDGRGTP